MIFRNNNLLIYYNKQYAENCYGNYPSSTSFDEGTED